MTPQDASDLRPQVDADTPSLSRIFDYFLGGGRNFAADRTVAEKVAALVPGYGRFALENRAFLRRALALMITAGIDQFLDLGAGVCSIRPVHDLVQAQQPDAKVLYVDRDPVVVAGLELIVAKDDPRTGVVQADLRQVDEVLDHAVTARLLDLSRPVGVLAGAVLHCLPAADDPAEVLTEYHERLAPGSLLAVSHASREALGLELSDAVQGCFSEAGITLIHRSEQQLTDLLGPWLPHPDGVVPLAWWRPDSLSLPSPERSLGHAVMADHRDERSGLA
ncbi:SAM-dependent methyltransferase [Actinophytocola sp. NPDC049390]|uniref:SAM-dependent methyltransferase n=1 Tax=Actinophytocola sp. NPDC049390 TaxID=3363894 RepID=UPI00378E5DCA